MEVWLESLSMHLSVGMPLPPDLLFDIQHYRGISPSSSGSTTPEGIPSGHRSPALEPIREGKMATAKKSSEKLYKSSENVKSIVKVSSAENLLNNRRDNVLKPIIKVSSSDALSEKAANKETCSKSCENMKDMIVEQFPNYENIDFLKNDSNFAGGAEKSVGIRKLDETELRKDVDKGYCTLRATHNNLKDTKFNVHLRKVPKNFTRNRFVKEIKENASRDDDGGSARDKIRFLGKSGNFDVNVAGKASNLNLDSISTLPSQVTEKYMNNAKNVNVGRPQNVPSTYQRSFSNSEGYRCDFFPDVVSSTLPTCSLTKTADSGKPSFSIGRHIFGRGDSNPPPRDGRSMVLRRTPVLQRRCQKSGNKEASGEKPAEGRSLLEKLTPILQRRTGFLRVEQAESPGRKPVAAGSLVKNMVNSLNGKGGGFGGRGTYGRSSLKVTGSPRVDLRAAGRSCSPNEEYTAL